MKMIPLLRCSSMKNALDFYTQTLDFVQKYPEDSADDWVVDLINGDAEIQLTAVEGDQKAAINVNVWVEDVDALFAKYLQRGLDISNKENSPVHQGPLDQTWGRREFYVTDPDGNTLRFAQPVK